MNLAPNTLKFLKFNPFSTSRFRSLLAINLQNGAARKRMNSNLASSTVEDSELEFNDETTDDVKATEKDVALRSAISNLAGDFGRESMLSLQRFFGARRIPVISTGSLRVDQALGIGGLPKGRMVEIYGQEASGKTTLALHIIKEAQKLGGYCAYLDVENALNPSILESIGVNAEKLLVSQPDCAENLLSIIDTLTKSGSVDVIVVDSVAALVPRLELDDLSCGSTHDLQSRIMTQALRKIHYSLCTSSTLIIFINQIRRKKRAEQDSFHYDEVTCGGNALKFYAAVRMRINRKKLLKTEDKVTGLEICVQVIKNKLAPSMKRAELRIQFGRGICCESQVLDLACEYGVILKEANSYFIQGEVLNGKEEAEHFLAKNNAVLDRIMSTLRCQLFDRSD